VLAIVLALGTAVGYGVANYLAPVLGRRMPLATVLLGSQLAGLGVSVLLTLGADLRLGGLGLPFAIAAQIEHPERPVACVLGDGGFLMYTGELETVARLHLPIVMLLMVDDAMSSIKVKQVRRGYPSVGVDFSRPDYAAIARGFGLEHARVADRASCRAALARAFESRRPTIVEAIVDPAEYETTQ